MLNKTFFVSTALILVGFGQTANAATGMPELNGTWISSACELRPQAGPEGVQNWNLTRNIVFNGDQIDAHFTTFADSECKTPLLELKFGGAVEVVGESTVANGAKEVNLHATDYLRVTPRTDAFRDFLNSAESGTCGDSIWEVGVEQDIYVTGCSVMGVQPSARTIEYELLFVNAGQLYFGARPVNGLALDNAKKRPTALQIPLQLKQGGMTRKVGADDVRVPQVVETVIFKQQADADPMAVREMFENITVRMNQNDTLLYRTVAQGAQGNWFIANYWESREAMETLNAQAQSWTDETSNFSKLVDLSSFQLHSYDLN